MDSVRKPSFPNTDKSDKPVMPHIIEKKIRGTAINFKRLIKIVPNGAIQLFVNSLNPNQEDIKAHSTPITNPTSIFMCNGNLIS